jgi:hypothetical protein
MRLFLTTVFASVLSGPSNVYAEVIGFFFDSHCSVCNASIPPGDTVTLSIRVMRGGVFEHFELTQAEFRVGGLPTGWTVTCTSNPAANVLIEDPFGAGVDIAFFPFDPWHMHRAIRLQDHSDERERRRVPKCTPPPLPNMALPSHKYDDHGMPFWCMACASTVQAIMNGPGCTVGVQNRAWSMIKKMYD